MAFLQSFSSDLVERCRDRCRNVAVVAACFFPAVAMPVCAAESRDYRTLAPGVLTDIPSDDSTGAVTARVDVPATIREINVREWKPETSPRDRTLLAQFEASPDGRSKGPEVQRNIWCLGFSFKPPRLIDVDVPVAGLKMARRRMWYLVYRVRNEGIWTLEIDPADTTRRTPKKVEGPIRFLPLFVLETRQAVNEAEGLAAYRGYADRSVPVALAEIERRERIGRPLLDTVAMSADEIKPGEERWGVAIWENVHPDIQFFSIVASGLTNRFQVRPPAAGDAGPSVVLESLRLDFWHRGDNRDPAAAEIGLGYSGLFERSALGARVIETFGRLDRSKAEPQAGLQALRIGWDDLLEPSIPEAQAIKRSRPSSLGPLATAIDAIVKLDSPSARARAVRDLFGDGGAEAFGEVIRGVTKAADGGTAADASLESIGVAKEAFDDDPLVGLAKVVRGLDRIGDNAKREAAVKSLFGTAAARFDTLARGLAAARAAVVLAELGVDPSMVVGQGPRQAFDRLRQRIDEFRGADGGPLAEDARERFVAGIFGSEGPVLYEDATRRHEGIDHEWFFRYEIDD